MTTHVLPPAGIVTCPVPHRALMGPGPSDMPPRVVKALGQPAIGHLDPAFVQMMEEIKGLLRYAFQTENALTFAVSTPGSVGMETCFVNLVEPGDKVILCLGALAEVMTGMGVAADKDATLTAAQRVYAGSQAPA